MFAEQARGLVQGGADLIIIETAQDILEVKAAVFGAREAFKEPAGRLPIQCSVSLLPQGGKMLLGTDISAVLTTLEALDVDVIGLNCSTGPEDMRDAIRFLGETSRCPSTASRTPACRSRARTARRSSPSSPSRSPPCSASSSSATASRSSAAAAARRLTHIAAIAERCAGARPASAPAARPAAPQLDDRRDAARPGPAPDARRRAGQLAGLAQGQGDAAGRRLRRPRDGRRGPGHRRRARARRLRGADRAPGRGRADAPGRQAHQPRPSPRRSRSTRPSPT